MEKINIEKWQSLEHEFLNGNLDDVAFCKSNNLNLEWFRRQLRESELRGEKPDSENGNGNLFVELVPQLEVPGEIANPGVLRVSFREVEFELADGFPAETFRQALQVIREVL